MPCSNSKIAKQHTNMTLQQSAKSTTNQKKKNNKILKQAKNIFWRYEHSIPVQGYEKQENSKAKYIESKKNYNLTTKLVMQMDFSRLETEQMDICFNEMMNDKNVMLRTGANMLECMLSDLKILKSASVILKEKEVSADFNNENEHVTFEATKARDAAIKADILVKEWAKQYKESDKNLKADWI